MAHKYLSLTVNVFSSGSPSLMRRVLLISLGITMRPKSSTRRTMPVAFLFLSSPYFVTSTLVLFAEEGGLCGIGALRNVKESEKSGWKLDFI